MNWRWAQENLRRRRKELEQRKAEWPHEPSFEEVREQVLAALRGKESADLNDLEDEAVLATGLDRHVVSDALWLMIDLQDLIQERFGTSWFSIRTNGEEQDEG